MQTLRKSTQVKVRIGPFVDVVDGFTPQVDITLGGDEAELLKHSGAATVDISGNTWAAVTGCRGWYDLTLTVSNTDTEGLLTVVVQDDSDCLPVFAHFMVVSQDIYDGFATKLLANKAVQTKSTGVVVHYDDDGVTPILTLTPTEDATSITRTPS